MSIIFVDRVHATALALPKNFVAWAMPTNYLRFQTTFASIVFVDRVHATALALPKNFVAWASPTSQSRFQTTCPPIISVGRTHATDTVPTKTDTQSKHERSSENLHRVFRRPLCVHHFRGQSPRYGASVTNRPRSVGFHEPLKIPTNNPPKIPDAKKADPTGLLSILPINPDSKRRRCKRPARRPNLPARQSVSAF